MKISEIDVSAAAINIAWQDGHKSTFHTMWLRDNDHSAVSRHSNGQRLFNITDIPNDISIKDARIDGDKLYITFNPDEHHTGQYDLNWLRENCYNQPLGDKDFTFGYKPKTWTAKDFPTVKRHDFASISSDDNALKECLEDFVNYGWMLVNNLPIEDKSLFKVVDLFGYVRVTNYGELFDVKVVDEPINLAFTNATITPHTDNPYRNPTPSIQLLSCLVNETVGGDSGMVDGFAGAKILRETHPEYFELLTKHQVPYSFNSKDAKLHNRQPIIAVDDNGRVTGVAFNNRSVGAFNIPVAEMEGFYSAYRAFAEILFSDELQVNFKLLPGDCLVFDNIRTLHARTGYEAGGDRHLQGCYADRDSLFSKYFILKDSK